MKRKIHIWHLTIIGYLSGFVSSLPIHYQPYTYDYPMVMFFLGLVFGVSVGIYLLFMRKINFGKFLLFGFVSFDAFVIVAFLALLAQSLTFPIFLPGLLILFMASAVGTVSMTFAFHRIVSRLNEDQFTTFLVVGTMSVISLIFKFPFWDSVKGPVMQVNILSLLVLWQASMASLFGWALLQNEKKEAIKIKGEIKKAFFVSLILIVLTLVGGFIHQIYHTSYVDQEVQELQRLSTIIPSDFTQIDLNDANAHPIMSVYETKNRNPDRVLEQVATFLKQQGYDVGPSSPYIGCTKEFTAVQRAKGYILKAIACMQSSKDTPRIELVIDPGVDIYQPIYTEDHKVLQGWHF